MSDGISRAFAGLGRLAVRRRRAVLVVSGIVFSVAGAIGGGAIDSLSSGGLDAPNSDSTRAAEYLDERFGAGDVSLLLLVTAKNGDVDSPAVAAAGQHLTAQLSTEPGVSDVYSYWSLGQLSPMRSTEGHQAIIAAHVRGDQNEVKHRLDRLTPKYRMSNDVIDVQVTGYSEGFREASILIEEDLQRAEMLVFPLTAVVLLFVFRSVVAAALPLVVGGLAIVGTMFVLRVVAGFTEVSVFALNLTIAMGFGLAIDYSLFIVSRYREELELGHDTETAIVRTLMTAGRTVAFSAVTVAASLVALLIFPLAFLRSFGIAGIAVVSLAAGAAIITLPAFLAVLGPRIDRWSVRRNVVGQGHAPRWRRLTEAVMRRPVMVGTASMVFLVLLAMPFFRIEMGLPDWRSLPTDSPTRLAVEEFERNFGGGGNEGFPIFAVPTSPLRDTSEAELRDYASRLSLLPGVVRVDSSVGSFAQGGLVMREDRLTQRFVAADHTYLAVIPAQAIPPFAPRAIDLVDSVRAEPSPFDDVVVGGQTAAFIDSHDALFDRVPLALAMIVIITFVVLFLAFGSVVVPLKAMVLNLLSLTATFGAMVWVFQDGHLSSVLGFTPRETIDIFNPILMFAVAFGLSMDYEVFLLSRVKEEYDRTGDNTTAVVAGVERTARLITAAALLLAIVFLAQLTSRVAIPKMFGLGMALAVLVDAFIIRSLLVPSFMQLAGRYNWWAPAWMQRVHRRVNVHEAIVFDDLGPLADRDGTMSGAISAVADANGGKVGRRQGSTRPRPLVAAGREPAQPTPSGTQEGR